MVMAVRVIVAVIIPVIMRVVMPAVRAVNMLSSTCFRVAMAAVLGMVVMVVMVVVRLAAVVMTRVCGCAVGAALGFKSFIHRVHDQVHGTQQVGQYMVWLDLQVVRLELNRHMTVAQVIGRTCQVKGRAV